MRLCYRQGKDVKIMMDKIRVYMTAPSSTVLGPYNRFILWVQGCNKRCKGCIAKDAWDINGGEVVPVERLAEQIIAQEGIEGITISGGEPFLQQEALYGLIQKVREQKNIGVIIYTGMKYEEIKNTALANCADIVIDGEYIEELNDDKSLRGSSNQNVVCLTDRYRSVIDDYYGNQGRKIELVCDNGITRMIGVPSKGITKIIGV